MRWSWYSRWGGVADGAATGRTLTGCGREWGDGGTTIQRSNDPTKKDFGAQGRSCTKRGHEMKNAWFNWVRYGVAGVFGMRKRCAMNEECSMLNAQSSKGKRTGASNGARWSGRVAAVVVAALCLAGAGSSAWGFTGTFTKITSTSDLASGDYLVIKGKGGSYMSASVGNNWIYPASPAPASMTNPDDAVVFKIVGDNSSGFTMQEQKTNAYLYASATKKIATTTSSSTASKWTFKYSSSYWMITNKTASIGALRFNSTGWRPYTSGTGTLENDIYRYRAPSGVAPVWGTIPTQDTTVDGGVAETMTDYLTTVGTPTPTITVASTGANTPAGSAYMDGNDFYFFPDDSDAGKTFVFTFTASNASGTPTATMTVNVAAAAPSCGNHWLAGVANSGGSLLSGELATFYVGDQLDWEYFGAINTDTSASLAMSFFWR